MENTYKKNNDHKRRKFRYCAKDYMGQKRRLEEMEQRVKESSVSVCDNRKEWSIRSNEQIRQYRLLKEQVRYTEAVLDKIGNKYGNEAREIVRDMYIDCVGQKEIAHRYHYSLRTMQRRIGEWMEDALRETE